MSCSEGYDVGGCDGPYCSPSHPRRSGLDCSPSPICSLSHRVHVHRLDYRGVVTPDQETPPQKFYYLVEVPRHRVRCGHFCP